MNKLTELRHKNGLEVSVVERVTKIPEARLLKLESDTALPTVQELSRLAGLYDESYEPLHADVFCNRHEQAGNDSEKSKRELIVTAHGLSETKKNGTKSAEDFLLAGVMHQHDRASQRDTDGGERSMTSTVKSFNAMYGTQLTEEQGWMFMVFLKASRASQGNYVADDYEDGCSYFALAGEAAAQERAA